MTFEGLACRPNAKFAPRSAAAGPSLSGSGGPGRSGGRSHVACRAGRDVATCRVLTTSRAGAGAALHGPHTSKLPQLAVSTAVEARWHAAGAPRSVAGECRRWRPASGQRGLLLRREAMARAPRSWALRLLGSARLQSTGLLSAADEHMRASPTTRRLAARPVVTSLDGVVESVDPHGKRGR